MVVFVGEEPHRVATFTFNFSAALREFTKEWTIFGLTCRNPEGLIYDTAENRMTINNIVKKMTDDDIVNKMTT